MDFVSSRRAISKRMWIGGGVVLAWRRFYKRLYCKSAETCPQTVFTYNYLFLFLKSAGAGLWQGNAMILFKRCRNGARDWIANVFLWRLRFEFEELLEYLLECLQAQVTAIASPHAEPCNTANLLKAWERWSLEACRIMFKCVLVWTVSWCKQKTKIAARRANGSFARAWRGDTTSLLLVTLW